MIENMFMVYYLSQNLFKTHFGVLMNLNDDEHIK